MDLEVLDRERGGPLLVRFNGATVALPSAVDLSWRAVMLALTDNAAFVQLVWPEDIKVPIWQAELAQQRWVEHNGLPDPGAARWLAGVLSRYYDAIEYDLMGKLRLRLGDLWRERRWREMVGYIRGLPNNSRFGEALMADEEYLEAVLARQKDDDKPSGPKLSEWSLLNSQMARLIDAVNRNTEVTRAAAGGKPSNISPEARPITAAERVKARMQRTQHESMVSLLLRDRPDQR